jgi:hypothetical protein
MKSTQNSNVIWRSFSRTRQLMIICNSWTIVKTFDDFWRDEIKNISHISQIFHRRVSNFYSTQASDFTTIALNFSISRDTIIEIHREIREINHSINSTIEDLISTSTHIRAFRLISIRIFRSRDISIEILKNTRRNDVGWTQSNPQ